MMREVLQPPLRTLVAGTPLPGSLLRRAGGRGRRGTGATAPTSPSSPWRGGSAPEGRPFPRLARSRPHRRRQGPAPRRRGRRFRRSACGKGDVTLVGMARATTATPVARAFFKARRPAFKLPPRRDPALYFVQRLREQAPARHRQPSAKRKREMAKKIPRRQSRASGRGARARPAATAVREPSARSSAPPSKI